MVGCTTRQMEERCTKHLPESKMGSSTPTWALTLSIIKHMGLTPEVVSIPMVVTAEPQKLPIAERLVTTLARSRQTGYNITEDGERSDVSVRDGARYFDKLYHLCNVTGWALTQLEAARKELKSRCELYDKFSRLHAGISRFWHSTARKKKLLLPIDLSWR
jgi:hypothetical protein